MKWLASCHINDYLKAYLAALCTSLNVSFREIHTQSDYYFRHVKRGDDLRSFIQFRHNDGDVVILVGAVNEDLHVAAQTKSFLIGGSWVGQEDKVLKYGIPSPLPSQMTAVVEIIANQTKWYYETSFADPVPTRIVALCRANTFGTSENPDEKEMAEKIQAILKGDGENEFIEKALMCHLMAGKTK